MKTPKKPKPVGKKELIAMILESERDIRNGNILTHEEVVKYFKRKFRKH